MTDARRDTLAFERASLTQSQMDRMKGTEFFAELLMSLNHGGIINKKVSLDRAIGNDTINAHTLGKLVREPPSASRLLVPYCPPPIGQRSDGPNPPLTLQPQITDSFGKARANDTAHVAPPG